MASGNPYPGVTKCIDRHGKIRWRFRRTGQPSRYLPGPYGSEKFRAAYEHSVNGQRKVTERRENDEFSVAWLIEHYMRGAQFGDLGEVSKKNLLGELERFRRAYGAFDIRGLGATHVECMMANLKDHPSAANKLRKLVKRLMRFAMRRGWVDADPTIGVRQLKENPDGFYTWTDRDIEAFEAYHPIGTKAHLAMHLMLGTGAARADVIKLGWANIRDGRIFFTRQKTRQSVTLGLNLLPSLSQALERLDPDTQIFLTHTQGRSYKPETFGNWFKDQVLLVPNINPKASPHGLRKAGARRLAESGATEFEIMSFLGHRTTNEARTYVRAADRGRLADSALNRLMTPSNPI